MIKMFNGKRMDLDLDCIRLTLCPSLHPFIHISVVGRCAKGPGLYPHLCNYKSALPQELKGPQVRAVQGGPAITEQPSIQWTSPGLKTAASTVPLAH